MEVSNQPERTITINQGQLKDPPEQLGTEQVLPAINTNTLHIEADYNDDDGGGKMPAHTLPPPPHDNDSDTIDSDTIGALMNMEDVTAEEAPIDIEEEAVNGTDTTALDMNDSNDWLSNPPPIPDSRSQQFDALQNTVPIFEGATARDFAELSSNMDEVVRRSGMNPSDLGRKSKGSFSPEKSIELFGQEEYTIGSKSYKYPTRGHFYCTHGGGKEGGCSFFVPFSYKEIKDKSTTSFNTTKAYIIKGQTEGPTSRKLCLTHNHDTVPIGVDGWLEVKHLKDMCQEEVEYVKTASTLGTRMPSLQEGLALKFPGRMFDSQLLHRIIKRERTARLGPNHGRLPELINLGETAKANGGAWETTLCPDTFTLQGTRYQTPRMREYAMQYGSSHCTVDGTYGCNMYGLTVMPFITPDCLGHMHCIGFTTSRSENSKDVIAAGELYGLSSKPVNVDKDAIVSTPVFTICIQHKVYKPQTTTHVASFCYMFWFCTHISSL